MSLAPVLTPYTDPSAAARTGRQNSVKAWLDTQAATAARRERRVRRVRPARPARLQPPHRPRRHRRPGGHARSRCRDQHHHGNAVTGLREQGYSWAEIGLRLQSPARLPSNAGAARDPPAATAALTPNLTAREWGRLPTTRAKPSPGATSAPGNGSSPRRVPAPTPSGSTATSRPSTAPRANSPPSTTHPASLEACCTWRVATAANRSAWPALRCTSATPASSSAPVCPVARASRKP